MNAAKSDYKTHSVTRHEPDNLNKVIDLDLISTFLSARQHLSNRAASDKCFCQETHQRPPQQQPLSRLALAGTTEAHFIRPLHHLLFPFYKPLISIPLPPSLSLTQSPTNPSLVHLIFSNLLRFPHLLSCHRLPRSLSVLAIVRSHSQACEVKDLCNLLASYC